METKKKSAKSRTKWTAKEKAAFAKRLRTFRDSLPEDQRGLLRGLMRGAAAIIELNERRPLESRQLKLFAKNVTKLSKALPAREKEAFEAAMGLSATGWAFDAGRSGKRGDKPPSSTSEPGVVYFWHWVHIARTAAVVVAGIITVIREALDDDEESITPPFNPPPIDEPVHPH